MPALYSGLTRVPHRQAFQRRDDFFMFVPDDDQHVVEPGAADLADRAPDQRLAAERQEQFVSSPCGSSLPRRARRR